MAPGCIDGFLLRPLSGAAIGHLGDKFGRKKMFVFTVMLMALPTTLMGLLPTYAQIGVAAPVILLLLRLLQGIAIAGEFAGASVFVTEHVPANRLATASGWLLGSSYIGFFLGAGAAALMANLLEQSTLESWGWRVPFLLGGLLGLLAVYLRRQLDETPMFPRHVCRTIAARARHMRRFSPAFELVRGSGGPKGAHRQLLASTTLPEKYFFASSAKRPADWWGFFLGRARYKPFTVYDHVSKAGALRVLARARD
jgi:MFS family permease